MNIKKAIKIKESVVDDIIQHIKAGEIVVAHATDKNDKAVVGPAERDTEIYYHAGYTLTGNPTKTEVWPYFIVGDEGGLGLLFDEYGKENFIRSYFNDATWVIDEVVPAKVSDSITKDKTIVFHSTHSREELANILLKNEFSAGREGGAMLGPGFYANQHLRQAQKGNYGNNILKAQVYGIDKFLILDSDIYSEIYGTDAPIDFVWQQIKSKGITKIPEWFIDHNANRGSTARLASPLWDAYGAILRKHFSGFVYTGLYDYESIVCWYPAKHIKPLEVSFDKGQTWISVNKAKEIMQSQDKKQNLRSAEAVRTAQRAYDLINRYEKYSDDRLANAIKSQLSRIADPTKKQVRFDGFVEALTEVRPSVIDLIKNQ